MGKKRIVKKSGEPSARGATRASQRTSRRRLEAGTLYIEATYNNTKLSLADGSGNVVAWSTSGALGFSGARKGTPFAAAKVGELIAEKAETMGMKDVAVVVSGVGAGRESSIRAFASRGFHLSSIKDVTPVPHNGPRPPKPRRV